MNHYSVEKEFQGGYTARRSSTKFIVVHHAAALYKTATGIEDVRAVATYHTKTRGWPGIGYSIALAEETNGGAIARYDLSDLELERAHVWGRNQESIGVSCLTNFAGLPEQKWIDGLVATIGDLKARYPSAQIIGHGEYALPGHGTTCPGPRWPEWKPQLLARIGQPSATQLQQVKAQLSDTPEDNFAAVRQGRGREFPEANINGVPWRLQPGTVIEIDDETGGWAHLHNGMGFVHTSLLQPYSAPTITDDLSFQAAPRITRATFVRNLVRAHSPAAVDGPVLYQIPVDAGLDPAVAEAFFRHESSCGTVGRAVKTLNWGNLRHGRGRQLREEDGFAVYANWADSLADWCDHIKLRYIAQGLDTVRKAVPVYAPRLDGNVPEAYIKAVIADVRAWQKDDQV